MSSAKCIFLAIMFFLVFRSFFLAKQTFKIVYIVKFCILFRKKRDVSSASSVVACVIFGAAL